MANTIENEVVSLEFDNKKFEKSIEESMRSVDKFKDSLDFKSSQKSMDDFEKSAKKFNLDTLGEAAEKVKDKFTLLGQIGYQALERIATMAVNAGERLVKSLSIDQVKAGWTKFEKITQATQTIMAASRDTWEDDAAALGWIVNESGELVDEFGNAAKQIDFVQKEVADLTWFADETSYSLDQMTSSVGKFIAAGAGVEESKNALEGIALWAGASGAGVEEANRAFYNLSQSMGMGYVALMDWKSIENANMGTKEFKEIALQTAEAMGTIKKTSYDAAEGIQHYQVVTGKGAEKVDLTWKNFREGLQGQFLTKDVLVATTNEYSKFTKEAKKLFDEYSDNNLLTYQIIEMTEEGQKGGAEAVRSMAESLGYEGEVADELTQKIMALTGPEYDLSLRALKLSQQTKSFKETMDATGDAVSSRWARIFTGIFGNYEQAAQYWSGMTEFFYSIFAEPLEVVAKAFETWNGKAGGWEQFRSAFDSMYAGVLNLKDALSGGFLYGLTQSMGPLGDFARYILDTDDTVGALTDKLLGLSTKFQTVMENFAKLAAPGKPLSNAIDLLGTGIGRIFSAAYDIVRSVINPIWSFTKNLLSKMKLLQGIGNILNFIGYAFGAVADVISNPSVQEFVTTILDNIGDAIAFIWNLLVDVTQVLSNFVANIMPLVQSGLKWVLGGIKLLTVPLKTVAELLWNFFSALTGSASDDAAGGGWVVLACEKMDEAFETVSAALKKVWDKVINSKFFGYIKSGFELAADAAGKATSFINDKLKSLFGSSDSNLIDKVVGTEEDAKEAAERIYIPLEAIGDASGEAINRSLGGNGKGIIDRMADVFGKVKAFFQKIWAFIKPVLEPLIDVFRSVLYFIKGTLEGLGDAFRKFEFKDLKDIGMGFLGFAKGLRQFNKMKIDDSIANLFDQFAGGANAMRDTLLTVKNAITEALNPKDKKFKQAVKALVAIAVAIGILTLSIRALTKLDPKALGIATGIVTGLIAELVAATLLLTKNTRKSTKAAGAIVVMAAAIYIMAKALGKVAKYSAEGNLSGAFGLVMLGSMLGILMNSMANIRTKTIGRTAGAMVVMSAAIYILGTALAKVAKSAPPDQIMAAAAALVACGTMLTGMMYVINKLNTKKINTRPILGIASALIIMSAAVFIISKSVKDWKQMAIVSAMLGVMSVVIVGILFLLSKMKQSSTTISGALPALIGIGICLIAVAAAIRIIANLDWKKTLVAVAALSVTLIAISAALRIMPKDAGLRALAMVPVMISLLMLSGILAIIGSIPLANCIQAVASIVVILGAIVGVTRGMPKDVIIKAASLAIISASLLTFAFAMQKIGDMDFGSWAMGLAAILVIMLAVVVLVKQLAPYAGSMLIIGQGMVVIAAACAIFAAALGVASISTIMFAGALLIMGKALLKLAPTIIEFITIFTVGMIMAIPKTLNALASALLNSVSAVLKIIGEFVTNVLVGLQTFIPTWIKVAFAFVVDIILGLAEAIPDLISAVAKLLVNLFEGLTAALPKVVPALAKFIGTLLAEVAKAIGPIMEGLTKLVVAVISALSDMLDQLDPAAMLKAIVAATYLSVLEGILIAVALEGVILSLLLVPLGGALSGFAWSSKYFFEMLKEVTPETAFAAKCLGDMILALTGAAVLEGIGRLFGAGDITTLAAELIPFGAAMAVFGEEVSGIDTAAVTGAANAGKALAEMAASMPRDGGIIALFAGSRENIVDFMASMVAIGPELVEFYNSVRSIKPDVIEKSADAGKALAGFASAIPNNGGLLAQLIGDNNDISGFGNAMANFGGSMHTYYDAIKDLTKADFSLIEASAAPATALAKFAAEIPNSGGLIADIFGDNDDIETFGTQMVAFAASIVAIAAVLSVFPSNDAFKESANRIERMAEVAVALAKFADEIPNSGGWWADLWGDNTVGAFAEDMVYFAAALAVLSSEEMQGKIDLEFIRKVLDIAIAFAEMASELPNYGGFSIFMGSDSFSRFQGFAVGITAFMEGMVDGLSSIKNKEIPEGSVNKLKAIAAMVGPYVEMLKEFDATGGVEEVFNGSSLNTAIAFARWLPDFIEEFMKTTDKISNKSLNKELLTDAVEVAKNFLTVFNGVKIETGGFKSLFEGDVAWDKFPEFIEGVVGAIIAADEALGDGGRRYDGRRQKFVNRALDFETVKQVADVASSFAEIKIPEENFFAKLAAKMGLKSDIESFGNGIQALVPAIKTIATMEVSDDEWGTVNSYVTAVKNLVEVFKTISSNEFSTDTAVAEFTGMSEAMPTMKQVMEDFKTVAVSLGLRRETMSEFVDASKLVCDLATTYGQKSGDLPRFGDNFKKMMYWLSLTTLPKWSNEEDLMAKVAEFLNNIMTTFKESFIEGWGSTDDVIRSTLMNHAKDSMGVVFNEYIKAFKSFTSGETDEYTSLNQAVHDFGVAVADDFVAGVKSSYENKNGTFYKAVVSMLKKAQEIAKDENYVPTITPVWDFSKLQNELKALDGSYVRVNGSATTAGAISNDMKNNKGTINYNNQQYIITQNIGVKEGVTAKEMQKSVETVLANIKYANNNDKIMQHYMH